MQVLELRNILENLDAKDYASCLVRSLRTDEKIWTYLTESSGESSKQIADLAASQKLNPGTLGLLALNSNLINTNYPDSRLQVSVLEDCMVSYESFLQQHNPPKSLEEAAKLALVLIEKRKIAPAWKNTLLEVVNRMHLLEASVFKDVWGTALVITANLVKDQYDLLSDLLKLQTAEQGIEILVYCVISLPISEPAKASKLLNAFQDQPPALMEKTLNYLFSINEKELAHAFAQLLIGKYTVEDVSEKQSKELIDNPETALQHSMFYKHIASIAQLAGDTEFASKLLAKSGEILDAISMGIKVQSLSLLEQTGNKQEYFDLIRKTQLDQNVDQIMVQELASVGVIPQNYNQNEIKNNPVVALRQAKKIQIAGNSELAKTECEHTFINADSNSIDSVVNFKPQFNPSWNPGDMVNTLLELGANSEAAKLAIRLHSKNPASLSASIAAAETFYANAKYNEALPLLEYASMAGEKSAKILRKLAYCYDKVDNSEACYKVRKQLVEIENPEISDMLEFADAAITAGRSHEVFQITSQIIEKDPTNASALTINGKAYAVTGNRDRAQEFFRKAIDIGTDDADPWIGLSDLQIKGGEFRQAIDTLRQGLAALPANNDIKRRLAIQLMENGSASDALPLLNELADVDQDETIGVLQAEAMKTLGLPEYDNLVVSLYDKFPENEDIAQAFASQLIKNGKHAEAKLVLQGKLAQTHTYAPTALTYAEAVVGMDVHYSGEPKSLSSEEMEKAEAIVNRFLEQDSDNSHAQLVQAELLVSKGDYQQSYEVYSKLLEKQTLIDKSLWERIQAGFALTSAFLGKYEVALAAIKQAVDVRPEWAGLRKIMANIYAMAGEVSDAVEQAERVLEVAPNIIESALWFADFLNGMGKSDIVENKLGRIVETKSNDLILCLKLAETKIKNGNSEEASQLLDTIKTNLSVDLSDNELLSAAKLYDRLGETETTLHCLDLRYQAHASLSAGLDLAGYKYNQGHFGKALQQLEKLGDLSNSNGLINCLRADLLVITGDLDAALNLLQEDLQSAQDDDLVITFVPDSWKIIINSNHPELAMQAKILLLQGKAATCLEVTKLWLADDNENAEARIMAIESSLALGIQPDDDLYQPIIQGAIANASVDHLLALKINACLEKEQAIEAQQLFEKSESVNSLSLKLAGIQLTLLTGHLSEAERAFDDVILEKDAINESEYHIRFGLVRLLVKTAVALQRWNEALSYCSDAVSSYGWNLSCVLQALSTLTRAKEFEEAANILGIEVHNPSAYLQQVKLDEEIDWLVSLTGGKTSQELERWVSRGKMAASPIPENIRTFALITPTPEDAAAMVAALHLSGQETTAKQVAKKFPTNAKVLFELARIQADGEESLALETLDTLIANDPLIPAAVAFRSSLYEKIDKLDMAINDLEQAIGDWPNEIQWRIKVASLWQSYGNNKNAILQLQDAYEMNPAIPEVALELGKAFVVEGDYEHAIQILVPLTQKNPNLYEAWEILAEAQSEDGQLDQALESAKKASKVNPFSIKPYLMSGKIHLLNGNLDKALDQAKLAATQNKKDANAILFLAKVLNEKGEKQQALAALEMTNQCDNVTVQTMVDHVNLVKEINGGAYAKELISSFSSKYPENVDLMKMLATAQRENGETADAEQTVKRALQVEPDEPELHLFLGKISAETGQLDQAIHHLSQGIAHKAANTDGYIMLSKVYEQQREFTKALDALQQAMKEFPRDTRSYLAAANLYRNSKNYSAAEKVLQKAVAIDPQDVTIRRQLGALLALKLVHHSQEESSQS